MALSGVAIGDLHLDALRRLFPTKHLELQLSAVRYVLDWAISRGINHAFFLGDIADGVRLSEEALIALYLTLVEYDGKINMHFILGNHDVKREGTHSMVFPEKLCSTKRFKTVFIYDKPTQVEIDGIPVNFLPFPHTTPIETADGCMSLNFGHFERPGSIRDNGSVMKKGGVKEKTDDIWIIGHLHTKQRNGRSIFPGTLYQKTVAEKLPKGFLSFEVERKGSKLKPSFDWIETEPPYKLEAINLKSKKDVRKLSDDPNHLYWVTVPTDLELPVDFLQTHPNVYQLFSYKTQADLEALVNMIADSDSEDGEQFKFDLKDGVPEYLSGRGLKKKEVEWALREIDRVVEKIQRRVSESREEEEEEDA